MRLIEIIDTYKEQIMSYREVFLQSPLHLFTEAASWVNMIIMKHEYREFYIDYIVSDHHQLRLSNT